jgi:hypothetical protein
VFDVYALEIMNCRRSGITTSLPDAYGRGRIIATEARHPATQKLIPPTGVILARPRTHVSIIVALFATDGLCVALLYGAPPPYSEALLPFHIVPPADTLFGPFGPSSYEFTKADLAIGTPIYKP